MTSGTDDEYPVSALVARLAHLFGALDARTLFLQRAVDSGELCFDSLFVLTVLLELADEEGFVEFDGETYAIDLTRHETAETSSRPEADAEPWRSERS